MAASRRPPMMMMDGEGEGRVVSDGHDAGDDDIHVIFVFFFLLVFEILAREPDVRRAVRMDPPPCWLHASPLAANSKP